MQAIPRQLMCTVAAGVRLIVTGAWRSADSIMVMSIGYLGSSPISDMQVSARFSEGCRHAY